MKTLVPRLFSNLHVSNSAVQYRLRNDRTQYNFQIINNILFKQYITIITINTIMYKEVEIVSLIIYVQ